MTISCLIWSDRKLDNCKMEIYDSYLIYKILKSPQKWNPLGGEHCHENISGELVIFLTKGSPSYNERTLGFHLHLEAVTPLQNWTKFERQDKNQTRFPFHIALAKHCCNLTHQYCLSTSSLCLVYCLLRPHEQSRPKNSTRTSETANLNT